MSQKRKPWDPDKSGRLLDAVQELSDLVELGEIDPTDVRLQDLRDADVEELRYLSYVFTEERARWAQDLFPTQGADRTGFNSFLAWASEFTETDMYSGKRNIAKVHRHTLDEIADIRDARSSYMSGALDRDSAILQVAHIECSDGQLVTYFPHDRTDTLETDAIRSRLETTLTDLQKGEGRQPKDDFFTRIKGTNPLTRLGDLYASLIGSAINLAHIDDSVYEEFVLSPAFEDGELAGNRNIVDFIVLPRGKRSRETNEVTLYEVKLGRQRGRKIEDQLRGQAIAAKEYGWNPASVLVAGSQFDMQTPRIDTTDDGNLVELQPSILGTDRNFGRSDEVYLGIPTADSQFEGTDITVRYLSDLLQDASAKMVEKLQGLKGVTYFIRLTREQYDAAVDQGDDMQLAEQTTPLSVLRNLFGMKGYDGEYVYIETRNQSTVKKYPDAEVTSVYNHMFSASLSLIGNSLAEIGARVQSRTLSLDEIEYFDTNFYLLNHYIRTKFRSIMGKSKIKFQRAYTAIDELSSLVRGITNHATYGLEEREEVLSDSAVKRMRTITRMKARVYEALGKEVDYERLDAAVDQQVQGIRGQDLVEFWEQYLPNVERVLQRRSKLNIHYLDEAGHIQKGRRVIKRTASPNDPTQWLEDKLVEYDIDFDPADFDDPIILQEFVAIVEGLRENEIALEGNVVTAELGRLEKAHLHLDTASDDKKYARQTNIGLARQAQEISQFYPDTPDSIEEMLEHAKRSKKFTKKAQKPSKLRSALVSFINKISPSHIYTGLASSLQLHDMHGMRIRDLGFVARMKRLMRGDASDYVLEDKKQQADAYVDKIHTLAAEVLGSAETSLSYVAQAGDLLRGYLREFPTKVTDFAYFRKNMARDFPRGLEGHNSAYLAYSNAIEKYAAGRLLQTLDTAKALHESNPEAAAEYLTARRSELKTGQDNGSQAIVGRNLETLDSRITELRREIQEHAA